MFFKQFYLNCLAHASYMVADENSKRAVVVDPQRDIDQYEQEATRQGFKITDVVLTHLHADFVSGHLELRESCNARIWLGSRSKTEYEFQPARDGEGIDLGSVKLKFLETPGHTLQSVCVLVYDTANNVPAPYAVLTGDTLFVGDVGRPDLLAEAGIDPSELAGLLYDSVHEKLLKLPDDTLVYPAHGAGSMCGKNLGKETFSTIGQQKKLNYACRPMSKEEFIGLVTADQPAAPAYFSYDVRMNQKEHQILQKLLDNLRPLSAGEFMKLRNSGVQVLDTRDASAYAAQHLRESINIGLKGQFATWCGTVLDSSKPIILICEPGTEREAAMRLGRIGFDQVLGYSEGGIDSLMDQSATQSLPRIKAVELNEELKSEAPPLVLDVRNAQEFSQKRIEGVKHIPLDQLRERCHELPNDRKIVVHCAGGYRSAIALGILQSSGRHQAIDMSGGIASWEAAGLELKKGQGAEKSCEATRS